MIETAADSGIRFEERVVGEERLREAWEAVQGVLARDPSLAADLAEEIVRASPERLRPVRTCPRCPEGRLHVLGRPKLKDGSPAMGAFVLCDRCGFYSTRR